MPDFSVLAELPDSANPHYLRAVTDMAGKRSVVAHDAIYSDTGIKLVEKGKRISARLYDQLVQHRLREPIENQLRVENAVDVASVITSAKSLAQNDPLTMTLVQSLGSIEPLLTPLRSLPLPAPIAFKLTVMREQRFALFEHSVQMVLVSLFLGVREGLDARALVSLAAAALLHDAGALHMDPVWLDTEKKITGSDRKHLAAHPVTAMLLVRDANIYAPSVERAVLEHHERMDGTGYPRGLSGPDISVLGRILLLAEVVSAFYAKFPEYPARQLSLMLRLNHHKFPPELVAHVWALLQPEQSSDARMEVLGSEAEHQREMLVQVLERWQQVSQSACAAVSARNENALSFVDKRVRALEKTLAEAGAHPAQQSTTGPERWEGNAEGLAEMAFVGREALWQLRSIANGCLRHWPPLAVASNPSFGPSTDAVVAQWCEWVLQQT